MLEADVPFYVHEIDAYWNDVGSIAELRQGIWDVLDGTLDLEVSGRWLAEGIRGRLRRW